MHSDEQRLRFRDAMASLSAAVNVITTAGDAGRCGITATAVCSVTDSRRRSWSVSTPTAP